MRKMLAIGAAITASFCAAFAVVTPALAGRAGGPTRTAGTVASNDCDDYSITFRSGERARVWAAGDGDIDIFIYDAQGRLLVKDDLVDFRPEVSWTPSSTQSYTICVKNAANYEVDYVLRTN